jgi:hypothetical protein
MAPSWLKARELLLGACQVLRVVPLPLPQTGAKRAATALALVDEPGGRAMCAMLAPFMTMLTSC